MLSVLLIASVSLLVLIISVHINSIIIIRSLVVKVFFPDWIALRQAASLEGARSLERVDILCYNILDYTMYYIILYYTVIG